MLKSKICSVLLAVLFLCSCEPVDSRNSVMWSTKNEISEPIQDQG